MIGLMASLSVVLAASSLSCDHFAHFASFLSTSSRTLVSTRITALGAARQRENLLGIHAHGRPAAKLGEFAGVNLPARTCGTQRNVSAAEAFKCHGRAGFQTEVIADLFWHRDLAFAGEIGCHKVLHC